MGESPRRVVAAVLAVAALVWSPLAPVRAAVTSDVFVYGATPSGIMASVAASRAGSSVVLVEPGPSVGGMMTNGLSWTDRGDAAVIGGLADEFFDRVQALEGSLRGRFAFQPSTALAVFESMLAEAGVQVVLGERLMESAAAVTKVDGTRIVQVTMESGATFQAATFVDASYEGDLMARAGVSYRVGREGSTELGETQAGVRPAVDVVAVPSGMDLGFPIAAPGPIGTADDRIPDFNYRPCLSTDPNNQVAIPAPDGYDPARYEILLQYAASRVAIGLTPHRSWFLHLDRLVAGKWDLNENGPISLGLPGANADYPTGSYARRAEIDAEHRAYQQGFLYFLWNDPRVPAEIRTDLASYGLCADEFTATGNWPRVLYLREGRRMVGETILSQHDIDALPSKPDTIGIASYRLDSHVASRWVAGDRLLIEGALSPSFTRRWSIPYRAILPRRAEATNLLVPVAASATHVAYSSLRMEPQYMIMGHAAGLAASIAAAGSTDVQDVSTDQLAVRLGAAGAVLDDPGDIADSFYYAIEWAYYQGITFGCAPRLFCPREILPRDQMASLLARALELPDASRDYFVDDHHSTHELDINRVAEAGITLGCAPDLYCPDNNVTREQMASFLVRAFGLPPAEVDYFTDDSGSTHQNAINSLAASGITAGCTIRTFCPKATVTRGQTLAFLFRHYGGGPSGGWTPPDESDDPDTLAPADDEAVATPDLNGNSGPSRLPEPSGTPAATAGASPAVTPSGQPPPTGTPEPPAAGSSSPPPTPSPTAPPQPGSPLPTLGPSP